MDIREICTRHILFLGGEDSCRFNDILSSSFAPTDSARIVLLEDVNGFVIDEKLSILCLDFALEATMN